ncbi:MAG TPA: FHA domain-containing protein [Syntrophobacter fumaroxidans]|nr:FHA domain-containing protein [Syntrophobacter fumaroxidans]
MPMVKMKFEGEPVREFWIGRGGFLSIGREKSNDVVIDNLGVSRFHAKIDSVDDRFLLTDLDSKNGTYVNEAPVTSHWLSHGEVITIGKYTLAFTCDDAPVRPGADDESPLEQTMMLSSEKRQELVARSAPKISGVEVEKEEVGVLSFLAGGSGEMTLQKKLTKIGKDALSDIVVSGLLVGRTAAAVSNRPTGYYLSYVGGLAKPKVNGETVRESVKLKEFDVIEVGSAKMQFLHKFVSKEQAGA